MRSFFNTMGDAIHRAFVTWFRGVFRYSGFATLAAGGKYPALTIESDFDLTAYDFFIRGRN